jgi:hypothetical protein
MFDTIGALGRRLKFEKFLKKYYFWKRNNFSNEMVYSLLNSVAGLTSLLPRGADKCCAVQILRSGDGCIKYAQE